MKHPTVAFILLVAMSFLSACASQRPVLYPRANRQSSGQARAQADISQCTALARQGGVYASSAAGNTAKSTAETAAVGGAVGAAAGAVYGRAGRGAAAGAAGAATGGLLRSLFRGNRNNPDAPTRRFIELCLSDRGYRVLGWR